jgi:hypothetical protein
LIVRGPVPEIPSSRPVPVGSCGNFSVGGEAGTQDADRPVPERAILDGSREPVPGTVPLGSRAELSIGDEAEPLGTDEPGSGTGSPPFRGNREPGARSRAQELVEKTRALGINLRGEDGQILARPIGLLTPDLRAELAAAKPALLELLTGAAKCNIGCCDEGRRCLACGFAHGRLEPNPPCDGCGDVGQTCMLVTVFGARYCRSCRRTGGPRWER